MKAEVCQILNIMTESLSDKYLGLPSMIGVEWVNCFKHLIERIQKMVNGWKERTLSYGGKESLTKAVAEAIPTYAMSVFKFPKKSIRGSLMQCRGIGGVTSKSIEGYTGLHGGRCVCQRIRGHGFSRRA